MIFLKNIPKLKMNCNYIFNLNNFNYSYKSSSISIKKTKKKSIHLSRNTDKKVLKIPNYLEFGLKSLKFLAKNVNNPRYLGFSEFLSSNSLQNSSYIWSIPKAKRMRIKDYIKLNDNIYNIPDSKMTRSTNLGYGRRKNFLYIFGVNTPSPAAYNLKSLFDINLIKKKGTTLTGKPKTFYRNNRYIPGPGTYNISSRNHFGLIPITLKSKHFHFYDDMIKQKRFITLKQLYYPKLDFVQRNRFRAITFGIGERPNLHTYNGYPGPGAYNVPGCFDRGLKGKLPLN